MHRIKIQGPISFALHLKLL